MTTTTKAATAERILAIDLGKYKSVACWYDPAGGEVRFESFTTSADAIRRLFGEARPAVVIEACQNPRSPADPMASPASHVVAPCGVTAAIPVTW